MKPLRTSEASIKAERQKLERVIDYIENNFGGLRLEPDGDKHRQQTADLMHREREAHTERIAREKYNLVNNRWLKLEWTSTSASYKGNDCFGVECKIFRRR